MSVPDPAWPWRGPRTRRRLDATLERLRGEGALDGPSAGALRAEWSRPWFPWPAFAAHLVGDAGTDAVELGLAVAAACPAVAGHLPRPQLAALLLERAGVDPIALVRWGVGSSGGWPENPEVGSLVDGLAARVHPGRAGAASLGCGCAAAARGLDREGALRAAAAWADAVAFVEGLLASWTPARRGPVLDAWTAAALDEPSLRPAFARALAGSREGDRGERLRVVLATDAGRAWLERRWTAIRAAARAAWAEGPFEPLGPVLEVLDGAVGWCRSYLSFQALGAAAGGGSRPEPWVDRLDRRRDEAAQFLDDAAPWADTFELRRRGLAGHRAPLTASWFGRAFVVRALARAGANVGDVADLLLDELSPAGPRYYDGWDGVPPDSDSLSLAFELADHRCRAADLAGARVALEAACASDGVAPTWLWPRGPDQPEPDLELGGDDCAAVRLALVGGMLAVDPRGARPWVDANLADVLARDDGVRFRDNYYYPDAYADVLFLRVARRYRAAYGAGAPCEGAIDRTWTAVARRSAAGQRLDGGWGGPLETAFRAMCLVRTGAPPLDVERAARCLLAWQWPDGGWPAEPLYVVPARREQDRLWFGSRSLSTAACAWALAVVSASASELRGSASGSPRG